MSHLLIIHVGPVQEFIASARRSRDLWFGSWLLSELSKVTANIIVREEKNNLASLIFPAPDNLIDLHPNGIFDVANKIVAFIENDPNVLAEKILINIKIRLNEIKGLAFKNITDRKLFKANIADKQVNDLIEFFWVAKEFDRSREQEVGYYKQQRKTLETLMAARKTTRNFVQPDWGNNTPKSSLDGQRESVIDEKAYDEYKRREQALRKDYGVRPGERLCGIGLLKRHGYRLDEKGETTQPKFFSTSHVAALPFIEMLNELTKISPESHEKITQALEIYIIKLTQIPLQLEPQELGKVPGIPDEVFHSYDGHLLYEERLSDFFDQETQLTVAKKALEDFYKDCEPFLNKNRPQAYYSLLLADGDKMGKIIDHQQTSLKHREISQALTEFAKEARKIVTESKGSLVYAGGDDVLAFVPINKVLDCAKKLAENFQQQLSSFTLDKIEDNEESSPTLSVGIAVVHHLEPLSEALNLARAAEKSAKSIPGKNALAVTVSKRSGSDLTVKGKWHNLDENLEYWIKLHCQEQIPDGVAYELRDLALSLSNKSGFIIDNKESTLSEKETTKTLTTILQKETIRIFERKRVESGSLPLEKEVLEKIQQRLKTKDKSLGLVQELADEIIVARIFADALKNVRSDSTRED